MRRKVRCLVDGHRPQGAGLLRREGGGGCAMPRVLPAGSPPPFFSIEIEFDTFFTSKSCGLLTFRGRNVVEVDPCLRERLSGASGSLGPGLPRGEAESSPSCPAIDAHRRPPHAFHTRPRLCEPRIADFRHVRTSRPRARFTKRGMFRPMAARRGPT